MLSCVRIVKEIQSLLHYELNANSLGNLNHSILAYGRVRHENSPEKKREKEGAKTRSEEKGAKRNEREVCIEE